MPCGQENCRGDPLTSSLSLYTSAVAGLCPCYFLPNRHRSFFKQQIRELGHYDEVMKEFVHHTHPDELEKIRDTTPYACPSFGIGIGMDDDMGMDAQAEEASLEQEHDKKFVITDQPHSQNDCDSPSGCAPEVLVEPDTKRLRTLIKVEGYQTPDNQPPKNCSNPHFYTVFH